MDEALAREIECTLVTIGRTSGPPRSTTIWFAAVGRTMDMLSGGSRSRCAGAGSRDARMS